MCDGTIEPVHSHCLAVEEAEMTKFRGEDFQGHAAGSGAVREHRTKLGNKLLGTVEVRPFLLLLFTLTGSGCLEFWIWLSSSGRTT